MPLALALQNVTGTLKEAVRALSPWLDIVPREETIVERARSAFLVHWFGPRLPFTGLSLRAHIVNTDALSQQYLMAQRSIPSSPRGPNLTEPLLGFAGMVAGVMLSPAGGFAGFWVMLKLSDLSVKTIIRALGFLVAPTLLVTGAILAPAGTAMAFGGLVAAGAGGYALIGGLTDRRDLRAVFNLFGGLARLMNAIAAFLGQLTGDRSRVRNPLLAGILQVADRLAALVAHGLGAVAIFIRRVGPILVPVARMLVALGALVGAAIDALGAIAVGLTQRLGELGAGGRLSPVPIVRRVMETALVQFERVQDALTAQMGVIATALVDLGQRISEAFDRFLDRIAGFLTRRIRFHPVTRVINAFKTQIGIFTAALPPPPPPPAPGTPPPEPSALDPLIRALPFLPRFPTFPGFSTPDVASIESAMGGASVPEISVASIESAADRLGRSRAPGERIALGSDARAALDRALRRPSVFESERLAWAQELGRSPEEALELNRRRLGRFRETFAVIVGRVLPPEMRAVYAPRLAEILALVDEKLYGIARPSTSRPDLPVLDLPTSDMLRPVVKTIRIRAPGAELNDVKRFRDLVLERIRGRTYRVGAPAAVGAP